MKRGSGSLRPLAAAFALVWLCAACGCGDDTPAGPPRCASDGSPLLLVVNGLAETMTLVRPDALCAVQNAVLLGEIPNDVAIDSAGESAVVVDSGDNDLLLLSLAGSPSETGRIDLGVGSNPYAVALDGRWAFVTLLLPGEVARVDLTSRAILWRVPVGQAPQGILLVGTRLFVAITAFRYPDGFGQGEIAVLDAASGDSLGRISVGVNPQTLALAPDGRVHVVCTGNYGFYDPPVAGSIYVLDPAALAVVDSIPVGGSPVAVAFTRGGTGYVSGAAGGVVAYDALTLVPRATPVLARENLSDLVWDEDRERLFAVSFGEDLVYVLDTRADTLLATVPAGDGPLALALRR